MEVYDKQYDRVTTKNEKKLKRINRIFHKVTTTDDPIIREVNQLLLFKRQIEITRGNVLVQFYLLNVLVNHCQ